MRARSYSDEKKKHEMENDAPRRQGKYFTNFNGAPNELCYLRKLIIMHILFGHVIDIYFRIYKFGTHFVRSTLNHRIYAPHRTVANARGIALE